MTWLTSVALWLLSDLLPLTFRTSQWNFTKKKVNILDSGCRKRFMLALGIAFVFLDFLRLLRGGMLFFMYQRLVSIRSCSLFV